MTANNMKPQGRRRTGPPSLRGLQGRSATGQNGQAAKEELSAIWGAGCRKNNSGVPAGRSVFHLTSPFIGLSPAVKRWAKLGRPSGAAFSSGIWGVIVVRGWRWTGGLPRAVFVPSRKRLQLADVAFRLRVVYHRGHGGTQRNPASNKWDGPSGWRGRIAHLRR